MILCAVLCSLLTCVQTFIHHSCENKHVRVRFFFPLLSRYGVAFTYYGITLNISGFGLNPYLTQFIFASIEMPMKVGVYFFVDKFGRRPGEICSLLMTGLFLVINMFVPTGNF